jgi:hypothetical protein
MTSSKKQSVAITAKLRYLLFIADSSSTSIELISYMTFPACSSFTVILISVLYISPVSGMGIDLPAAVALDADIRIRMARLAGLQVSPRFSCMIRIPVKDLCSDGLPM